MSILAALAGCHFDGIHDGRKYNVQARREVMAYSEGALFRWVGPCQDADPGEASALRAQLLYSHWLIVEVRGSVYFSPPYANNRFRWVVLPV